MIRLPCHFLVYLKHGPLLSSFFSYTVSACSLQLLALLTIQKLNCQYHTSIQKLNHLHYWSKGSIPLFKRSSMPCAISGISLRSDGKSQLQDYLGPFAHVLHRDTVVSLSSTNLNLFFSFIIWHQWQMYDRVAVARNSSCART